MAAVIALMICQPLAMVLLRLLNKPITRIHWATCGAVIVFGSVTLLLRDPVYIKIKSTVLFLAIGVALAISLWLKRNPAKAAFGNKLAEMGISDASWRRMAWQWAALAVTLGVINLAAAFLLSEGAWVNIKVFGFPVLISGVMTIQFVLLFRNKRAPTSAAKLQHLLQREFTPTELTIEDESDDHLGHPEATGGKHFRVRIFSAKFVGLRELERHRLVYAAVGSLQESGIHALSINALDPSQDSDRESTHTATTQLSTQPETQNK